ncbi:MAG: DUF2752 domain-containing protein [Thermodesulfobacteriota bacterium]|nr:DUF2752 domain-containing protein [Thermodesulfobacteriota bacterium]
MTVIKAVVSTSKLAFIRSRLHAFLSTPVLAPMMQDRRTVLILGCLAALQVWLVSMGLPGWQCPIKLLLGIPCPGCGLTAAMAFLMQGRWRSAIVTHAFAPVFFAGIILALIVSMLPSSLHQKSVSLLASLERRTGFMPLLLMLLLVYWTSRLLGLV